jgi:hypothetical protein
MPKFLIEVQHDPDKKACKQAAEIFLKTGSHFLTNADWGCLDGEHKAWFVLHIEDRDAAMSILPMAFRKNAKIIELNKFALGDMENIQAFHEIEV